MLFFLIIEFQDLIILMHIKKSLQKKREESFKPFL